MVVAAVLGPPALAPVDAADTPLAVGAAAPDFTLPDHQGKPFRLTEALARRDFIVVAFFVKAFTGG
jgi:peroxiredoxin